MKNAELSISCLVIQSFTLNPIAAALVPSRSSLGFNSSSLKRFFPDIYHNISRPDKETRKRERNEFLLVVVHITRECQYKI